MPSNKAAGTFILIFTCGFLN